MATVLVAISPIGGVLVAVAGQASHDYVTVRHNADDFVMIGVGKPLEPDVSQGRELGLIDRRRDTDSTGAEFAALGHARVGGTRLVQRMMFATWTVDGDAVSRSSESSIASVVRLGCNDGATGPVRKPKVGLHRSYIFVTFSVATNGDTLHT